MTIYESIISLMGSLSAALGAAGLSVSIIRKDLDSTPSTYPYGVYTVPQRKGGGCYPFREEVANADPAQMTFRLWRPEIETVTLSFVSIVREGVTDPLSELFHVVDSAIDLLGVDLAETAEVLGIVVDLFDSYPEDLTTMVGSAYEYQVGFSFVVRGSSEYLINRDAIDLDGTLQTINFEV